MIYGMKTLGMAALGALAMGAVRAEDDDKYACYYDDFSVAYWLLAFAVPGAVLVLLIIVFIWSCFNERLCRWVDEMTGWPCTVDDQKNTTVAFWYNPKNQGEGRAADYGTNVRDTKPDLEDELDL